MKNLAQQAIARSRSPVSLHPFAVVLVAVALITGAVSGSHAAICPDADYGDELVLSNFQIVSQTSVGGGLDEVEVSADVTNVAGASFTSATATPDFSGVALGVESMPAVEPLGFPAIAPNGAAASGAPLRLHLPSANVSALMTALAVGDVPFRVEAAELEVLAPGVTVRTWQPGDDASPGGLGYIAGSGLKYVFAGSTCGAEPSIVAGYTDGDPSFYIVTDPNVYVPEAVPPQFRNGRVVRVDCSEDGLTHTWDISLAATDQDVLPDLVASATYCTTALHYVDWQVQATRLWELDGLEQPEGFRDSHGQGIRFNDLPFAGGGVTLSGQVQGHVMRPRFEIRFRNGVVTARTDIDSEISLSAEARVHQSVSFAPEEALLWSLCFPLPSIPLGPVSLPLSLHLEHTLGVEAELGAGSVVGFQKQLSGGVSVGYDGNLPIGQRYFSEASRESTPIEFTPPRLIDETGAYATVWTDIRTALRMGTTHPTCAPSVLADAEAYFEATAYGTLDVRPGQDPWWSLGHGADLGGGLGLTLFGLPISAFDAPRVPFVGLETLDGARPLVAAPAAGLAAAASAVAPTSGEDHRWAVSIDDVGLSSSLDRTSVAVLPDESVVVASRGAVTDRNRLTKLDRFGAFEWTQQYRDARKPETVHALPDGSVVVAGSPLWIAVHDSAGSLLWNREFELSDPNDPSGFDTCDLRGMAAFEEAPGQFGYVLVGQMGRGLVTQVDACAARVDSAGNVVWAQVYEDVNVQRFNDVTPTADGHFAVAGFTSFGADPFSGSNPLVAKLDGATGAVHWAKAMPMGGIGRNRSGEWNAIEEAPDGTLFLAGAASPVVTQTGGLMVGRIATNGSDVRYGILFQDEEWEGILSFEPFIDTPAGETPFDEAFDLAPVPGGFVVVGKTGLQSGLNLNEDAQAAWAFKVNPGLGVEWFTTIDGNPDDEVGDPLTTEEWQSVWPTPGGFVVSGMSTGFDPLGTGGGENTVVVMKYPYEGRVDFLPAANTVSRYVEPGVRFGSADAQVLPDSGAVSLDAPLTVYAAQVDLAAPIVDLLVVPDDLCVTLLTETGHPSLLDACAPDGDGDGAPDEVDGCPFDPTKVEPAVCGCGVADTDGDGDGTPDCVDLCAQDAAKTDPGLCGCGVDDVLAPTCTEEPEVVVLDVAADTHVRSNGKHTNEGAADSMSVNGTKHRALVRFDQGALEALGVVPVRAVLEVDLAEAAARNWTEAGKLLDVHRMTTAWEEGNAHVRGNRPKDRGTGAGATWACAVDADISDKRTDCQGTDWYVGAPRADRTHPWDAPTDAVLVRAGQVGTLSFDVTADVLAFLSGTSNHGWVIKLTDAERRGRLVLGTRESGLPARLILTLPAS